MSIEDDDAAYLLLQIAFEESLPQFKLHRAVDGVEGLSFLRKQTPFETAPTPNLVFLNLNLPKMNGREVLEEMRNDLSLSHVPVVVFSSSSLDEDRAACLALGANHYITKPGDYPNLLDAINEACRYAAA